jgi:hypothetical protein
MLFIAVPNEIDSFRRRVRKLKNSLGLKRGRFEGVLGIPRIRLDGSLNEIHLSHFTERSLSAALTRHGFDVVETSPDPYYVSKGFREMADTGYYMVCSLIKMITGRNVYDTFWIVGRKR